MVISVKVYSQQVADQEILIEVINPTYKAGEGPVVGIDAGHFNFHTLEERFNAFGRLALADGYQAVSVPKFSEKELAKLDILVISNPIHPDNEEGWKRPIFSAFTEEEIQLVAKWVKDGGALLLIADHMPFGGAAINLGKAFGVEYEDCFVMKQERTWPPEVYTKGNGTLLDSPVTEDIDSLVAFTGSALKLPENAIPIAHFQSDQTVLLPEEAWEFDSLTVVKPVDEFLFGGILEFGEGRAAFFTEAAMFTAQVSVDKRKMGFNNPYATQNEDFILNVLRWLTKKE
ncbi:MAG: hypothetical protein AAF388_22035 [Bacteroidota bacterium]